MSDRVDTIARMACDLRIADGMAATPHIHTEYIAEAIALYRQTERAVTEAYRTTSFPIARQEDQEDDETEATGCWACGKPVAAQERNPAAYARNECGRCGEH